MTQAKHRTKQKTNWIRNQFLEGCAKCRHDFRPVRQFECRPVHGISRRAKLQWHRLPQPGLGTSTWRHTAPRTWRKTINIDKSWHIKVDSRLKGRIWGMKILDASVGSGNDARVPKKVQFLSRVLSDIVLSFQPGISCQISSNSFDNHWSVSFHEFNFLKFCIANPYIGPDKIWKSRQSAGDVSYDCLLFSLKVGRMGPA